MARLKGHIKLKGSVEGLVYYRLRGKWVVRSKPNVNRDDIMKKKGYERTRQTLTEFGAASQVGAMIRKAMPQFYKSGSDIYAYQRMAKLMWAVKDLDQQGGPGTRTVERGLQNEKAAKLLKNFRFNEKADFGMVLMKPVMVNAETQEFTLSNFVPKLHLKAPAKAARVKLVGVVVTLDVKGKDSSSRLTEEITIGLKDAAQDVVLRCHEDQPLGKKTVPKGSRIFLMGISFEDASGETVKVGGCERVIGVVGVG